MGYSLSNTGKHAFSSFTLAKLKKYFSYYSQLVGCVVIFYLLGTLNISAQTFFNKTFNSNIKSVQLKAINNANGYPIININSPSALFLSFDDLSGQVADYQYTIIHCDANWNNSNLMESEYLEGIATNFLQDFQYSFNTTFEYVNYSLIIPNQDIKLKLSGNYVIIIFKDDSDSPVLTQRFSIVDPKISVQTDVRYPTISEFIETHQEVDFSILHPNFNISNPREEIKVVIKQNNREDNVIRNLKPVFIRNNELVYDFNRENIFEAGHEYRWFDTRSLRFLSDRIKNISFHDPYYHVDLFPEGNRGKSPYFYIKDFNGRFFNTIQEYDNPAIEADYCFVHFEVPANMPIFGGTLHLAGELTNYQLNTSSKMLYNLERKSYEKTLLLKQGFYNYQYLFLPDRETKGSPKLLEGNFSKTENEYLIMVYYRDVSLSYDQLIGFAIGNSLSNR